MLVPHGSRCCQCGTIDAESQGALRDGRRGRGVAGTRGCTGGHPCSRGGGYGIPKPIPYKTLIELTCRAASVLPTCQRSLSCQAGCLARQGPSVFTGHGLPGSSTHKHRHRVGAADTWMLPRCRGLLDWCSATSGFNRTSQRTTCVLPSLCAKRDAALNSTLRRAVEQLDNWRPR